MKKYISIIYISLLVAITGCDKTLVELDRPAYTPANIDANAGSWKTYILSAPTDIIVATPTATNSAAYTAELATLKNLAKDVNADQKRAIAYWSTGGVYRWNEIARELAAKYNLAPAATADGKYPVPDAANPLADPKFPFANPPYTARALAYMSVAQYDALVATWYYKHKFNRQAPSKVDNTVPVNVANITALPSYPSEDAVVAAASFTVLKTMFPGEVPYLEEKMKEHIASRQWAGMNVESDLKAGTDLGNAVATKVMARAKTDGMSASNNQTLTASMIEAAKGRGIKDPWVSQEIPARPPMLPNYGAVQTWNFDRKTLEQIRPAMPYVVGSAAWQKELDELKSIQKNQTREQARIANFWADGAGSYTPPGHWHRIAANTAYDAKYSEVKMARTLALLGTAEMDAAIGCWETKYYYYTPRPQQFGLKTSVGLPNFPSYTSGHSTFSAAAATVLSYIFPEKTSTFEGYAKEASESRIYGLIHYRSDCEMGLVHGKKIGEFAIARAKADGAGQ